MRAALRIGGLCVVLVTAGCAVDSDGDGGPKAGVPTSAAAGAAAATATTAPSATTTSEVEPPPTSASVPRAEAPDDPSPGETPAADPAEQPTSSGDEAPPDENIGTVPDALPDDEPSPEPESETLLTWQGIPVTDLSGTVPAAADGTVTAPRLLTRFDDVEVLLHNQDHAWTFNADGSVLHEWLFEDTVPSVFPDGTGGIVYLQDSAIFHRADPEIDPKVVVACPGQCSTGLFGLAVIGESREVVYTKRDHFETPEGYNPHYEDVLHRISLNTRETVRLVPVGGHEWGMGRVSITDGLLFGSTSGEAYSGWTALDLHSGKTVASCDRSNHQESGRDCPQVVTSADYGIAVVNYGLTDTTESGRLGNTVYILGLRSREADANTHSIPLKFAQPVDCINNLEVWNSVFGINNSSKGICQDGTYAQPHRAVLADFSTGEVELYAHPGFLRLAPRTEAVPETESPTAETWEGIPVITVADTAARQPEGTVTAPRLLRRFEDAEVLLRHQGRAWTFNPDGSIDKEWAFDAPVRTVFPDGAGGILYQDGAGFDDLVNNSSIHHLNEPGHGSKALVDCTGDCVGLWLAGVVYLGSSTEVVYTVESWPPLPDDAEYLYPTQTEVLHRFDLRTQESVELAPVGGWEWWFYNTVVVGNELFGAWGTDGGNGVVGYDLLDGSSIFGGFETAEADCFDTGPSLDCPRFAFASTDHIIAAFWDHRSTFIVSSYDRDSEEHRYTLPIAMPAEVNDINGIEVWDSVLIINTLVPEEATDSSQRRWMPYRAVLIDLETHETELYSHAGVLRVVARTAAG